MTTHQDTRFERVLVVVGIIVLGFNLRPAAVSVGPLLVELTDDLGMSAATAGVLTSLPVLAFAAFGATAPAFAHVLGLHRTTLLALLAVVVGLGVRSRLDSVALFLLASLLGLAGMATANVLLPSLVKLHFPDRVGLMTAVYTTAMAVGLTASSVLSVPVAHQLGSWRWGLGVWAVTALLASLPWIALVRHDTNLEQETRTIGLAQVARTRLGWAMALTFALQSLQAYAIFGWFAQVYRDAGYGAGTAGLLLGTITGVSIPLSFVIPALAGRLGNQFWLLQSLLACYVVGYVGLLVAPAAGAWLWALLLGAGTSVFPLVLTLIGLRTRTPAGTAGLSGFTQSMGYLLAAPGPFLVGLLYDVTGAWTASLLLLLGLVVVLSVVIVPVSRPRFLEDELPSARTSWTEP